MQKLPWNWRKRIEIVYKKGCKETAFILQWIKGKRPFRAPKRSIGKLVVNHDGSINNAYVVKRFRNRGLGSLLYCHALKHLGYLSTCWVCHSDDARRVWNSLIAEYPYETEFFNGRLTVYDVP